MEDKEDEGFNSTEELIAVFVTMIMVYYAISLLKEEVNLPTIMVGLTAAFMVVWAIIANWPSWLWPCRHSKTLAKFRGKIDKSWSLDELNEIFGEEENKKRR